MSITAYKGMDEHMQCLGFQYEVGKEYVHDGEVKCCPSEEDLKRGAGGFHACEVPLDAFNYYAPATSRFFSVTQDGIQSRNGPDSKVASSKIKIDAEIGIPGLVKAHIEYIKEHLKADDEIKEHGDYSAATNTGGQSAATNTGDYSAATNTGGRSAATNTGDYSAATNTGDYSAATNTGDYSAATNTGGQSAATNTGDYSAATNTGDYSAATNTGGRSAATNTGDYSAAINTGYRSVASVSGQGSVAIVTGYKSKAKASLGSAIVIVERGDWNGEAYPILAIKSAIIDGESLKPDVWYTLRNGEFVEVEE